MVELGLTVSPKAALIEAQDEATIKNRQKTVDRMDALVHTTLARLAAERADNGQRVAHLEAVSVCAALAGILIGGVIAIWVFSSQIRRPLQRVIVAMQRVASGELDREIPYVAKHDEMGELARALVVFRDAVVAKLRIEADADSQRQEAERERQERLAERVQEAAHDNFTMNHFDGLERLATGDLAQSIATPFGPRTERLRAHFNHSVEKLKHTMLSVVSTYDMIKSGTIEISSAANDLSRRSERQTANLEENTAALERITMTIRKTSDDATFADRIVSAAP